MPDLSYLPQVALSGVAVGCIYGLVGIGFCVIYNASGIVNFAQGAFVMMGGMIAYGAFKTLSLPLVVAAALAIIVVAVAGVVIERLVVRTEYDDIPTVRRCIARQPLVGARNGRTVGDFIEHEQVAHQERVFH